MCVFLQNYDLETADVSQKQLLFYIVPSLPDNMCRRKINKYITCLDAESLGIRFKVLENEWMCKYAAACRGVNID